MDRSKNPRPRLINLKPSVGGGASSDMGLTQEIMGIALGRRLIHLEQTEIWTVRGVLRDGKLTPGNIGELTFLSVVDLEGVVIVVNGFVAEIQGTKLSMSDEQLWDYIAAMIEQLGYDSEGFFGTIGVGGSFKTYDDFGEEF